MAEWKLPLMGMLTVAVAFLLLAIVAAVVGFLGAGSTAYGAAIAFFVAFLGAIALRKRRGHEHSD